ncbi:MAG: hypothetical protein LBU73_06460 [Helicobacteraceae bacterium]|nr:hypothetical protein [Helicobacteraceae bacterium]
MVGKTFANMSESADQYVTQSMLANISLTRDRNGEYALYLYVLLVAP